MTARALLIREAVRIGFWLALILTACFLIGFLMSWVGFWAWCLAILCLVALATVAAWAVDALDN